MTFSLSEIFSIQNKFLPDLKEFFLLKLSATVEFEVFIVLYYSSFFQNNPTGVRSPLPCIDFMESL